MELLVSVWDNTENNGICNSHKTVQKWVLDVLGNHKTGSTLSWNDVT